MELTRRSFLAAGLAAAGAAAVASPGRAWADDEAAGEDAEGAVDERIAV